MPVQLLSLHLVVNMTDFPLQSSENEIFTSLTPSTFHYKMLFSILLFIVNNSLMRRATFSNSNNLNSIIIKGLCIKTGIQEREMECGERRE